jgi:CO/xanthine dehydrogenase Mo-binding subunit
MMPPRRALTYQPIPDAMQALHVERASLLSSTNRIPRADNLPPLEITLAELPTAVNPLGVKGAGQAGCMAAPQTIINAILDALAPLGVAHFDMPATPERIWRAIRSARGG